MRTGRRSVAAHEAKVAAIVESAGPLFAVTVPEPQQSDKPACESCARPTATVLTIYGPKGAQKHACCGLPDCHKAISERIPTEERPQL